MRTNARFSRAVGSLLGAVALGALMVAPVATGAASGPPGGTVPLTIHVTHQGAHRAIVMVSVAGGQTVPVMLDTGSTGLHILASVVGTAGVTSVGGSTSQSYGSGTVYTGPIEAAPVTIGGITSVAPVDFMAIATVSCEDGPGSCPSSSAAQLMANGLDGTMGVALNRYPAGSPQAGLYSPLLQLPGGSSGYTITFQSPSAGTVALGAGPAPAGSTVLPQLTRQLPNHADGTKAWDSISADACWTVGGDGPVCTPGTYFDTGTPSQQVDVQAFAGFTAYGAHFIDPDVTVALSGSAGGPTFWAYTTGKVPNRDRTGITGPPGALAATGLPIFFACAVAYDALTGQVVVTPHSA